MANSYGLYDMAGNVFEWCWDWWDEDWYAKTNATEPDTRGPPTGDKRLVRGGSWFNMYTFYLRCAARGSFQPTNLHTIIGFRCVRALQ